MAIRRMVSWKPGEPLPANVEIDPFYSGHEAGRVRHSPKCPHFAEFPYGEEARANGPRPDCLSTWEAARPESPCSGPCEPLYMETSYEGLVLATGEHNGYDDSDFYAVVWDAAKGEPREVTYASTRGWTYPNGAWVDATPEVRAAYRAWGERMEASRRKLAEEAAARTPARGKTLRVVKGRKVAKGTVGECVWYGAGKRFSYYGPTPMRVGIRLASGEVVWTAASNVEVVLPEEAVAKAA